MPQVGLTFLMGSRLKGNTFFHVFNVLKTHTNTKWHSFGNININCNEYNINLPVFHYYYIVHSKT